ncbi:EKC/KEOPS complex subunit Tprkb-like [Amphiura filiformis]|uniref:EKC/KEOPS complex subunit Tprkb-like n=1 Tax=Amphiura filiformis TaxID=82378 RepID=UPI003B21AED1
MTSHEESHKLELFPGSSITVALFRDVKNVAELKSAVSEAGKIEATLLSPKLILSPFQIVVATNKAMHNKKYKKMKTRNVNSEVLFNLSPTNHITESFRKFGLSYEDTCVVVVVLDDADGEKMKNVTEMIKGDSAPLEELKDYTDEKAIKKLYKITEEELTTGSLLDAIVCRIALKDVS